LSGVAYGVLLVLVIQIVQLLYNNKGRNFWFRLGYVSLMFTLATIGFGGNVKFNQMTYIDDRNIPGGPNAFTTLYYSNWINMMSFACYVVMSWIADALVLYRFVIIWNYAFYVALFPVLMYAGSISMSVALLVAMTRPGASFWTAIAVRFGIAYWSLSVSLNIILTLTIAGRLLRVRKMIKDSLGDEHSRSYTSVTAMLVESAALYSIWGLVFIISYARNSAFQNLVLPPLGQVQGIAPLLIILRVARGHAWSRETMSRVTDRKWPQDRVKVTTLTQTATSFPLSDLTRTQSIPNTRSAFKPADLISETDATFAKSSSGSL